MHCIEEKNLISFGYRFFNVRFYRDMEIMCFDQKYDKKKTKNIKC